jgi:hypothetical protein
MNTSGKLEEEKVCAKISEVEKQKGRMRTKSLVLKDIRLEKVGE